MTNPYLPGVLGRSVTYVLNNLGLFQGRGGTAEEIQTKQGLVILKRPPDRTAFDIGDLKTALQNAERANYPIYKKLFDIYDQAILDDDYEAGTDKVFNSIHKLELVYNIGGNVENEVTEWIKHPKWSEFKEEILNTLFWGHSLFEFDYDALEDFFFLIPRRNVEPRDGLIRLQESDQEGLQYREDMIERQLSEVFGRKKFGLLLRIARPFILKYNSEADWADYSEQAGQNFLVVETKSHGEKNLQDVQKSINDRGAGASIAIPEGVSLNTKNVSSASQNDLFMNFERVHSNKILKILLGQSSTTNDDMQGSFAKSEVSQEEQYEKFQAYRSFLLSYLNYNFINYLEFFGFKEKGSFEFMVDEEIDPNKKEDKETKEQEEDGNEE